MPVTKLFLLIVMVVIHLFPGRKPDREKAYFHYYKGKSAKLEGAWNTAANHYIRAIRLDPGNPDYVQALVQSHLESGRYGKAVDAIDSHKQVFNQNDRDFMGYFLKGLAYACQGEHSRAWINFRTAEKLIPQIKRFDSALLSHLYNNLACEKLLNQAREWSPQHEDVPHLTISQSAFPTAYEYCARALMLDPDNHVAAGNLRFINNHCLCTGVKNRMSAAEQHPADSLIRPPDESPDTRRRGGRPYDVKLLPDNISLIVEALNGYDEVTLLLDISGSMEEEIIMKKDSVSRFEIMMNMAGYLLSVLNSNVNLGALTIGRGCDTVPALSYRVGECSREEMQAHIYALTPVGSTPLNERLASAEHLFSDSLNKKAILMFSDGLNTCGDDFTCGIAESLRKKEINIFILSFLLEESSEMEYSVYDCIASISDGKIYEVEAGQGISNKTLDFNPPYYSLHIPVAGFDTCQCLTTPRLVCNEPCNPVFTIVE